MSDWITWLLRRLKIYISISNILNSYSEGSNRFLTSVLTFWCCSFSCFSVNFFSVLCIIKYETYITLPLTILFLFICKPISFILSFNSVNLLSCLGSSFFLTLNIIFPVWKPSWYFPFSWKSYTWNLNNGNIWIQ